MTIPLRLKSYIEEARVPYSLITHIPTYTAQGTASAMHIPGKGVAKTIVLRAGEKTFLAVLPANYHANLGKLAAVTGLGVRLATEAECSGLFPDCELGAIPPFGELYGLTVYLDETLAEEPQIVFSAGTHSVAMCLTNSDFIHLAKPHIFSFAEQGSEFWTSLPASASATRAPAPGRRRETIFGDLFDFRREFDDIFHRLLSERSLSGVARNAGLAAPSPELPAIDAWTDNEGRNYHVRLALPGVDPQNIHIHVKGNALSVTAERKNRSESKDVNYLQRELSYRSFERMIALPEGIDTAKMTADYNDGVLEIDAPVTVAALPRRIEIGGATKTKTAGA